MKLRYVTFGLFWFFAILFFIGYGFFNGFPWTNAHDKKAILQAINNTHPVGSYQIMTQGFDFKEGKYELSIIFNDSPTIQYWYEWKNNELFQQWKYCFDLKMACE